MVAGSPGVANRLSAVWTQEPRVKDDRKVRGSEEQGTLLRGKPTRDGAIALAPIVGPVGAEPDPAVVEVHERRLVGREVVAGQIHVELLPADEPFAMG